MFKWLVLMVLFCGVAQAETEIYCIECKTHLYTYKNNMEDMLGKELKAEDFVPVGELPQPTERTKFACPYDEAPLNGYLYWAWSRGMKPPRILCDAMSILTKREGKFKFIPYEVKVD